jgi:hypothetical protein
MLVRARRDADQVLEDLPCGSGGIADPPDDFVVVSTENTPEGTGSMIMVIDEIFSAAADCAFSVFHPLSVNLKRNAVPVVNFRAFLAFSLAGVAYMLVLRTPLRLASRTCMLEQNAAFPAFSEAFRSCMDYRILSVAPGFIQAAPITRVVIP